MISSEEIHPDLQEMPVRDDFQRRKFILICKNARPEMISFDEIHPD